MIVFPNAKINIGLNVVSKRKDGFHNIETIFYPLQLTDILEIVHSDHLSFRNTGLKIDAPANKNLCVKTYDILKREYKLPEVSFHLHKTIPFGAGLGGGSSDAAYTIQAINQIFDLKISEEEQRNIASEIGSDCTFFLRNTPVYAFEKGNKFKQIKIDLTGHYLILIHPNIHINTRMAYSGLRPTTPHFSLQAINTLKINDWKDYIINDFEKTIFKTYPEVQKIKHHLYANGALYASMSGSGSSVYGIFSSIVDLKPIFPDYFYYCETL